ncbi:MAG: nucleotide exchange factor GrpE [Desulfuromonadales bacterium]|nr:nucleotide exchange factor GrpE [Desulfuromonadales bacterium]
MARKDPKTTEQTPPEPETRQQPTAETAAAAAPETAENGTLENGTELSPAEQLATQLREAQTEAARNWDLYLRERADLENVRKRTQREKQEAIRFANDRLLKELLPVLDNLERAVEHAGQQTEEQQGLLEGVSMTITLFNKVLTDFGLTPIVAAGTTFDPNLHQAMGQVETAEQPPNTVVITLQKGYLLNERLLRPALVMVAKPPVDGSPESDA